MRADRDGKISSLLCVAEEQDVRSREHLDANPFNDRTTKIHAVMIAPFAAACGTKKVARVTAECSAAQSQEPPWRSGMELCQGLRLHQELRL